MCKSMYLIAGLTRVSMNHLAKSNPNMTHIKHRTVRPRKCLLSEQLVAAKAASQPIQVGLGAFSPQIIIYWHSDIPLSPPNKCPEFIKGHKLCISLDRVKSTRWPHVI